MFDDPKKELQRMEEELFAAEYEEEAESGGEPERDGEDWLQQVKDLLGEEEPPIRNHANGYGPHSRNHDPDLGRAAIADEELDERRAVFAEEPKKKGAGGLVLLALLEVLGILAILWWWKQWLS